MKKSAIKKLSLSEIILLRFDYILAETGKNPFSSPVSQSDFELLSEEYYYRIYQLGFER